jgi:hypothetical protein
MTTATMNSTQLKRRLLKLKTRDDACQLASDLYGTAENSTGTIAERFIAGWVNAMDMVDESYESLRHRNTDDVATLDEGHQDVLTDSGFLRFCLHEVRNMGCKV